MRETHFWKCRCFAPLNLAEQGERTLSVGETMRLKYTVIHPSVINE